MHLLLHNLGDIGQVHLDAVLVLVCRETHPLELFRRVQLVVDALPTVGRSRGEVGHRGGARRRPVVGPVDTVPVRPVVE